MRGPDFLLTARHVHPGVNTAEQYEKWHASELAKLAVAYPTLPHRAPWTYDGPLPTPYVSGGVWKIPCQTPGCGNHPPLAPAEWGSVTRCPEMGCGAVYVGVVLPPEAAAIERLLVKRLKLETRHWAPPETVDDLRAENIAHGIPDEEAS